MYYFVQQLRDLTNYVTAFADKWFCVCGYKRECENEGVCSSGGRTGTSERYGNCGSVVNTDSGLSAHTHYIHPCGGWVCEEVPDVGDAG